eukprot:TRINITY_DN104727_c0_g1_i1.p1 TRINITY_DN104727_c0_g1~~TRINITY_DN104727_c0_g1_i1.p1  ORF type:complete len:332 (-),score=44.54 TRINITY_DN104727_c0_g1_i1:351-1346(-)
MTSLWWRDMLLPHFGRHGADNIDMVLFIAGSYVFDKHHSIFLFLFMFVKEVSCEFDVAFKWIMMPFGYAVWLVLDPEVFPAMCITFAVYGSFLWYQGRHVVDVRLHAERSLGATPGVEAGVVWLHGLGDSASGASGIAKAIYLKQEVIWCLPSAPVRLVSVDWGVPRRAWFNMSQFPVRNKTTQDMKGLADAVCVAHDAIRQLEKLGLDSSRIWICGWSQGGAVALAAALTYASPLGGAVCLGGWLPDCIDVPAQEPTGQPPLSVYWQHGAKDDCVFVEMQKEGVDRLREAGVDVTCVTDKEAGHVPSPAVVTGLKQWLQARMDGKPLRMS